MNPPFSAAAHVDGRVADAAMRHIASALARLADGGRLVAITGANLAPDSLAWRDAFVRLQERARIVFSAAIDGRVYARHGTTTETRLTVIDKVPAADARMLPGFARHGDRRRDVARLDRRAAAACDPSPSSQRVVQPAVRSAARRPAARIAAPQPPSEITGVELAYETVDWTAADHGHLASRSMRAMRSSPSASRARRRIRPNSSNRRRWRRSPRRSPPIARACRRSSPNAAFSPTPSSKASSMRAKHTPRFLQVRGRWTRPSMSSRLHPMMRRMPFAFAAAGCWATAPAPAKAARSRASSSTIGARAAPGRCGSPSPTS